MDSQRTETVSRFARQKNTIYTRSQIEDLIAQGRHIIVVEGKILKCDPWLPFHPGGDKAIKHMVGRDATDEVNALHSKEARRRMEAYQIGRYEGRWVNFVPPIQGGMFRTKAEQNAAVERQEASSASDDSSEDSEASSPVFDPTSGLRSRDRQSNISTTSSSATSLSSLELEEPSEVFTKPGTDRTQQELDADLERYPSLEPDIQDGIVQKYRQLNDRIRAEGLYDCNYTAYAIEGLRYTVLFSMCLFCLHHAWYATAGAFLGAFWHQLVFTAHDAGHMGITHDFQTDSCIGIFITDFLGGLSMGWWKRNHNVHHVVTNSPEHDPDIEHMPFFAISHRFFESLRSTYYERIMTYDLFSKFVVRYQQYLYYPILTMGRFNLYRLSWEHLILGLGPRKGPARWHRWLEIAGQVFFWIWFGYFMVYRSIPTWSGRIAFVMVSHMVTAPLHVQITLSHFAMSTSDLGQAESFPQKMLRTTMDVDCPTWLDFFHGGLQFQAIHHLYPRIPRHNLRKTQKLVQGFCEETGIPYALYGFVDGNKEVIGRLGDVGRQARVLAECQRAVAKKGIHEH